MNSLIAFRTRLLISGRAVMQEFEIGVSLEMYLLLIQQHLETQEARHIPGLCDARLSDII